jgi:tripartite-type tricarboxylate transporter receptor subunit TctC
VHPSVPAKNVKELVDYAKANPGKLTYATTGAGGSPHLCAELLSTIAGIKMLHVPYKGGAQAMTDLLSGQVALTFSNPTSVMQHVHSGRIRALAVTTAKRFSQMPDLPTMIEEGYAGFDLSAWYGLIAPKGTPPEIVNLLSGHVAKILSMPDVKELLAKQGLEAQSSTPEDLAKEIKSDVAMYAKLLKDAGVQPQ